MTEKNNRRVCFACALGVFVLFLLIYSLTAQRGLSWQDSGEFQFRVLSGDYRWSSGIARAHPLYIAIAQALSVTTSWLFRLLGANPETTFAGRVYAINFASGLGMAVALAFVFSCIRRVTGHYVGAWIAVTVLGFSQMVWWMSSMAEVYTWSLACLAVELYCVVRLLETSHPLRWMAILFLANGMHAAIHDFAFLDLAVLVPFAIWYLLRSRGRLWVGALTGSVGWCVGAAPLLFLFGEEWRETGLFWETVKSLLFGREFESVVMGTGPVRWRLVLSNLALVGIGFLNPAWLFAIASVTRTVQDGGEEGRGENRVFRIVLVCLTILHFLFWVRYFVPDQATFILPTAALLSVWVGLGVERMKLAPSRTIEYAFLSLSFSILVPLVLAKALTLHDFGMNRMRQLPFRQEASYWILPWKHTENSAKRFIESVADMRLGTNDIIVADNTAAAPLQAFVAGGHPLCGRIISFQDRISPKEMKSLLDGISEGRKAYLVSPVPGYTPCGELLLSGCYRFHPEGVLYRILPITGRRSRPAERRGS
ncbi:MAG: DUF2723 domain-containing protein [Kiritimatiellae bacterium]|nr:DUF2723 domain-containing protein [Kiritimatiellia bacterium]